MSAKCENDHFCFEERQKKRNGENKRTTAKTTNALGANEVGKIYVKKLKETKKEWCRRNVKWGGEKFSTTELILWRLKKFRFLLPKFFPAHLEFMFESREKQEPFVLRGFVVIIMFHAPAKSEKQSHAF